MSSGPSAPDAWPVNNRLPRPDELPPPPPGRRGWPWTIASPRAPASPVPRVRLSVVTPSYNQGVFLEEAIRSVLLQGYGDLEYFVMDGGSSDESPAIIAKYAPVLSGWATEPDGGQSDAVNKGWRRATGTILTYLNADDAYHPGAVAAAAAHLAARPDMGAVYGSYSVVDELGRVLEPLRRPSEWAPDRPMSGLPAHAMFFRRPVLDEVGMLDTRLHFAMDGDLCVRAVLAGVRFARVPGGALVAVRHWAGAKSFNWSHQGLAEVWANWDHLAADPRMPRALRARIPEIKARACLWPAYRSAEAGRVTDAARFLLRAARTHWPIVLSGEFLRILAGAVLGPRAKRVARAATRRPPIGLVRRP